VCPGCRPLLRTTSARYEAAATRLANDELTWVWPKAMGTDDPGTVRVELSAGAGR